jgi:hypothetical protein
MPRRQRRDQVRNKIAWTLCLVAIGCRTPSNNEVKGDEFGNPAGATQHAWFADSKREVAYCISVSDDFGVGKARVAALVEETLAIWKHYLETRHTVAKHFNSTRYKYLQACEANVDLRFAFGSQDESLAAIINTIDGPAGQHVLSIDKPAHWSKGIVWLAAEKSKGTNFPLWSVKENAALKGALLHQIGHILGLAHVNGTIMEEDLNSTIMAVPDRNVPLLTTIDWDVLVARPIHYAATSSFLRPQEEEQRKILFAKMTGKPALGPVTSSLQIANVNEMTLTLTDGVRSATSKFANSKLKRERVAGGFAVSAKTITEFLSKAPEIKPEDVAFDDLSELAFDNNFGTITAKLDQVAPPVKILVEFNGGWRIGAPIMVYWQKEDGKRTELFRAPTPHDLLPKDSHPFRNGILMD